MCRCATAASPTTTTRVTATRLDAYFADPTCGPYYVERGLGRVRRSTPSSAACTSTLRTRSGSTGSRSTSGVRYGSYDGGWQSGHGDSSVYNVELRRSPHRLRVGPLRQRPHRSEGALGPVPPEGDDVPVGPRGLGERASSRTRTATGTTTPNDYTDCDPIVTIAARMGETNHPYVDEALLTFEQQLGQDMSIGVDFIDRRFRSFMVMDNVNMDYELFTATGNPLRRRRHPDLQPPLPPGLGPHHRQRRLPRLPVGDPPLREALLPRLAAQVLARVVGPQGERHE